MNAASIEPARPDDEAEIRALLREATVPGEVALSFQREPSYAAGERVIGREALTLVARHDGRLVAVASAVLRDLFLAGHPTEVAYLSLLRVARVAQGRGLVPRGLAALREHLLERGLAGAFATISTGNVGAERVLIDRPGRRRRGFVAVADLRTLTFPAARRLDGGRAASVRSATHADLDEVLAFLDRHGPKRDLFPVVERSELSGALPGLTLADVLLARRGGSLRGVLAVWDQHTVRQTVVRGYGRRLTLAKPLLDAGRVLRGARALPRVGEALRVACASHVCVADADPGVANDLLRAAGRRAAAQGAHVVALTLATTDPLLPIAARRRHVAYGSRLVVLPLADPAFAARFERVPFVDAARL